MNAPLFIFGADPELMLTSARGLESAIGVLHGGKLDPSPIPGGALQHDNVLAEFNVSPNGNIDLFLTDMQKVLQRLGQEVAPLRLLLRTGAEFPDYALEDERSKIFGCDPDFDAWSVTTNTVPADAPFRPFRSAGGHIHIGKTEATPFLENFRGRIEMVRAMDLLVGVPAVMLDVDPTSRDRRTLYGRAGCHRPKSYGVEYRSLGNFWVRSPDMVRLMHGLTEMAVSVMQQGQLPEALTLVDNLKVIQNTINECDRQTAAPLTEKLLDRYASEELRAAFRKLMVEQEQQSGPDLYTAWEIIA